MLQSSEDVNPLRQQLPIPRNSAPSIFPTFDEDCDNFGFSWVGIDVNECGDIVQEKKENNDENEKKNADRPASDTQPGAAIAGFEERLRADIIFHNPAALDLMLEAYALPPHHSFAATNSSSGSGYGHEEEREENGKREEEGEEEGWNYKTLQRRRCDYMSDEFTEKAIKLTRQGKFTESLALLQKALSYHPGHVTALVTSGANQANLGRYGLAMRDFEEALFLDPHCANAQQYLTSTREKANQVRDISTITAVAHTQRQERREQQQQQQEREQQQRGVEAATSSARSSSSSSRRGPVGAGANETVLIKQQLQLHGATTCNNSSGKQTWSYVLDDDDDDYDSDHDDYMRLSKDKKKKDKKSHKKKDKKSDKKRKHKKVKSSSSSGSKKSKKKKKSRRRTRDSGSGSGSDNGTASSSEDGSSGSSSGGGGGRKRWREQQEQEAEAEQEVLHPILSRTKHKLWD